MDVTEAQRIYANSIAVERRPPCVSCTNCKVYLWDLQCSWLLNGRSVADVAKVPMWPWPYGRQGRCLGLIRFHGPSSSIWTRSWWSVVWHSLDQFERSVKTEFVLLKKVASVTSGHTMSMSSTFLFLCPLWPTAGGLRGGPLRDHQIRMGGLESGWEAIFKQHGVLRSPCSSGQDA